MLLWVLLDAVVGAVVSDVVGAVAGCSCTAACLWVARIGVCVVFSWEVRVMLGACVSAPLGGNTSAFAAGVPSVAAMRVVAPCCMLREAIQALSYTASQLYVSGGN